RRRSCIVACVLRGRPPRSKLGNGSVIPSSRRLASLREATETDARGSIRGHAGMARSSKGIGRARHTPRKSAARSGFVPEVDSPFDDASARAGERARSPRCTCADVAGFSDAAAAARDPGAPLPLRLALVAPNGAAESCLERWAEDIEY